MLRKLITILGVFTLVSLFSAQALAKEITVRGRLQRTVEAGGWVILSDGQKYLVLNARRFQSEKWFVAGAEVEAIGETKSDVMTTFMEGTAFEARTMRLIAPSRVRRLRRKSKRVESAYQGVGNWRLNRLGAAGQRHPDSVSYHSGNAGTGSAAG